MKSVPQLSKLNTADFLNGLGACGDSIEWVESKPGMTARELWDTCERGDWLLWLCGNIDIKRETLVFAACQCARLSLKHVKEGERRPLTAIETAESWTRGEASISDVRTAASAAYAASAADAAYAASAAAYAASAASAAAYAADAAADAAYAAASAAYAAASAAYAAAYAARARTLSECANLVRKHIPWEMVETAIAKAAEGNK